MDREKGQYEIGSDNGSPKRELDEHGQPRHDSVEMGTGDRKDSIVLNEAADLYGDIHTAESMQSYIA